MITQEQPDVAVRRRREAESEPATRVLLLHGMGLSGRAWDEMIAQAAPGLELWEADLPWTSNGSHDWTATQDVGQWVVRAARAADLSGRGFDAVVAHSFSATALLEALARGQLPLPRVCILIAPFYRARPDDFDLDSLAHSLENFPRLFEQGILAQARKPIAVPIARAMAERLCAALGPRVWVRFTDSYLHTPELPLGHLTMPVLVVAGEHDPAATPSDSRALAAALPTSWVEVLDSCGHFPMIDQPGRFAELVNTFLATH